MLMNSIEFDEMYRIVKETFESDLKDNTLDFLLFLRSGFMNFTRIKGYWRNQFYWVVKYKDECVCYILLNGKGDEKQFSPLTIWTDDSSSNWYENCQLNDELSKSALKNIDYCVHCGSCIGGTYKTVLGKGFDNVCRTVMKFTNPDEQEFRVIKDLVKIRKCDIENNF